MGLSSELSVIASWKSSLGSTVRQLVYDGLGGLGDIQGMERFSTGRGPKAKGPGE
jgi:hypothetical protein